MATKQPWWKFWGGNSSSFVQEAGTSNAPTKSTGIDDRPDIKALPAGRQSEPNTGTGSILSINDQFSVVSPQFMVELIPIIRALVQLNPDVSQAVWNIASLGNTGHKISFDRKVPTEQVDKMRNHLINKRKNWASGQAGMDGLVTKMFYQILISGALSNEWVPNNLLTGIQVCALINPENIVFKLDKGRAKYIPFQKSKNAIIGEAPELGLKPLNENTYKYLGLSGDEELPYGIPPYLSVIPRIKAQTHMDNNIDFIVDMLGLVGFFEALVSKPDIEDGETDKAYQARLDTYIKQAKSRIMGGVREGVVVGFKDDHEFKFNSASKAYGEVVEIYKNNELQIASALKQDASLWGRDYSSSEGTMGIVFMKMLSELRNIQNLIKTNLEFGYALELRLAGFNFDYLTVQFNRSTIQDDLKYQQAEEIKVRNVKDKYIMGVINQDQMADELGYEAPAESAPLVDPEVLAGVAPQSPDAGLATDKSKAKKDRKAQKNKSARTSRRKDKPNPKPDKK
jgi:hypothetical protein